MQISNYHTTTLYLLINRADASLMLGGEDGSNHHIAYILMPEMGNLDLFLEEPNPISFFCQLQWGCQRALQFAEYGNIHVSDSQK